MLFNLSGNHNCTPAQLGSFESVEFVRMNGADYIHKAALTQTLENGISHAAEAFQATFVKTEFQHVLTAIEEGRANANFIFLNFGNASVPAGVSITFPCVYPIYNDRTRRIEFMPVLYDEDFIVDKELSALFKGSSAPYQLPDGQTLAFRFVAQQSLHAATNELHEFPAGMGAKGMLVEYGNGCDAAFGLLKKLGAQTDTSEKNQILQINDTSLFKRHKSQPGIYVTPLASYITEGGVDPLDHSFAITTNKDENGFVLALTATRAISSFQGSQPKIRVSFATDGRNAQRVSDKYRNNPGLDPKFKCTIKSIIATAAAEISQQKWIGNGERIKPADIIPAMNFNVLGQQQIAEAIIALGGETRKVGKYSMKGAFVPFDTISVPEIQQISNNNDKKYIIIRNGSSSNGCSGNGLQTPRAAYRAQGLRAAGF